MNIHQILLNVLNNVHNKIINMFKEIIVHKIVIVKLDMLMLLIKKMEIQHVIINVFIILLIIPIKLIINVLKNVLKDNILLIKVEVIVFQIVH